MTVRRTALSWIEIVVVVAILGAVAFLTIPRLSNAAQQPDTRATLRQELKTLRVAIERYRTEHDRLPGVVGDQPADACDPELLVAQLTQYTDVLGNVSDRPSQRYCFGPYLSHGVPTCPIPPNTGRNGICAVRDANAPPVDPTANQAGWIYHANTGHIIVNSDATDVTGVRFTSY